MHKAMLIAIALLLGIFPSLEAADEASFDIVADKPYSEEDWDWTADVTSLYGNDNAYGSPIAQGESIIVDLPAFGVNGDEEMFRFGFTTNHLVNATVSISFSPFINTLDENEIIPVIFTAEMTGITDKPAGFSDSGDPGRIETAEPLSMYGETITWEMMRSPLTPIIGSGDWGSYTGTVIVRAGFRTPPAGESLAGRKWAMPISVTLTVEGQ